MISSHDTKFSIDSNTIIITAVQWCVWYHIMNQRKHSTVFLADLAHWNPIEITYVLRINSQSRDRPNQHIVETPESIWGSIIYTELPKQSVLRNQYTADKTIRCCRINTRVPNKWGDPEWISNNAVYRSQNGAAELVRLGEIITSTVWRNTYRVFESMHLMTKISYNFPSFISFYRRFSDIFARVFQDLLGNFPTSTAS